MRIGIIGGGSVGLLMGSYLCINHDVTIYVRRERQKAKINNVGLILTGRGVCHSITVLLLEELKEEDLLIVCVKQTQLSPVLDQLHRQSKLTPLLFLQNGMGHIEHLKRFNNPVLIGVMEHGALRLEDNKVTHSGKGAIKIASFNTSDQLVDDHIKQLNMKEFPIHKSIDWQLLIKEKLIVNAVINPLTAMFNVTNGLIITHSHIQFLARQICKEVAKTLVLNEVEQWKRVERIVNQTSENTSSMLTDIINKQETEIESILGYVINTSHEEIPFTLFAYHSIKVIEIKKEYKK